MTTVNGVTLFATTATGLAFATMSGLSQAKEFDADLYKLVIQPNVQIHHKSTSDTYSENIHFVGAETIVSEYEVLQSFANFYHDLASRQTDLGDGFKRLTTEELWDSFS